MTIREALANSPADRWHLFVKTETEGIIRPPGQLERDPACMNCEIIPSLCSVMSWTQYWTFYQTIKESDFFITEPRSKHILVIVIDETEYENIKNADSIIADISYKYINRRVKRESPVGYCHYHLHRGYVDAAIMKEHGCLKKQCKYLQKNKNHPYWEKREERKKLRKKRKKELQEFLYSRKIPIRK